MKSFKEMFNRMFNIGNVNYKMKYLEEIYDIIYCSKMEEDKKEYMIERLLSEEVKNEEFIGIFNRDEDGYWEMKSLGIGGYLERNVNEDEGDYVMRLVDINWNK